MAAQSASRSSVNPAHQGIFSSVPVLAPRTWRYRPVASSSRTSQTAQLRVENPVPGHPESRIVRQLLHTVAPAVAGSDTSFEVPGGRLPAAAIDAWHPPAPARLPGHLPLVASRRPRLLHSRNPGRTAANSAV